MLTQTQLWAVIAAPSVLVLIGILLNQRGLDAVNHRLERVEDRLLNLLVDHEQRITRVETKSDTK
jgi:hypothetical protein